MEWRPSCKVSQAQNLLRPRQPKLHPSVRVFPSRLRVLDTRDPLVGGRYMGACSARRTNQTTRTRKMNSLDAPLVPDTQTTETTRTLTTEPTLTSPTSTLIATMEPFSPRPQASGRAGQNKNSKRGSWRKTQPTLEAHNRDYPHFFRVSSTTGESLAAIDVVLANRQLVLSLGSEPKNVYETRDGALIVEVQSKTQSESLLNIKSLADVSVTVEPHGALNETKGTIYYRNEPKYPVEKLQEHLSLYNVKSIYQMKKKLHGTLVDLPLYVLTFATCKLPTEVKIGWHRCAVREYIPRPRRCYKCQRFNHGAKTCRATTAICPRCSEDAHDLPCLRPARCPNCGDPHEASSPDCYHYKLEQETLSIQVKQKLMYRDAKRQASAIVPRPGTTYASILRKNRGPDRVLEPRQTTNESRGDAATTSSLEPQRMTPVGGAQEFGTPNCSSTPTPVDQVVPPSSPAPKEKPVPSKPSTTPAPRRSSSRNARRPRERSKSIESTAKRHETSSSSVLSDYPMPPNLPTFLPPPMPKLNSIPVSSVRFPSGSSRPEPPDIPRDKRPPEPKR
jgi:hypothetical protein